MIIYYRVLCIIYNNYIYTIFVVFIVDLLEGIKMFVCVFFHSRAAMQVA